MTETRATGWLVRQLPQVLSQDDFIRRFVGAFEVVADSLREPLRQLPHLLDIDLTPAPHLRWLGSWLGLDLDPDLAVDRKRALLHAVAGLRLHQWRGTRRWLRELLEAFTGGEVHIEESGGIVPRGQPDPPPAHPYVHVTITTTGDIDEQHVLRLIHQEVPVGTTVELQVADHHVTPEEPAADLAAQAGVDVPLGLGDELPHPPGPQFPRGD